MPKANDDRIRRSQERTRLRLKQDRLQLEKEQRDFLFEQQALRAERTETIALLQLLCERYGETGWTDQTPLVQVIERHLFGPLEVMLGQLVERLERYRAQVRTLQLALATSPPQPPAPAPVAAPLAAPAPHPRRPVLLPETVHRCLIGPAQLRELIGYRANCTCGWTSPIASSEADAEALGDQHAAGRARTVARERERA